MDLAYYRTASYIRDPNDDNQNLYNYGWSGNKHLSYLDCFGWEDLDISDKLTVAAQFKDRDKVNCTSITQRYTFYRPAIDQEPHRYSKIPFIWGPVKAFTAKHSFVISPILFAASRWVPQVSYLHQPRKGFKYSENIGEDGDTKSPFKFKSQQRFDFEPSNHGGTPDSKTWELLTDRDVIDLGYPGRVAKAPVGAIMQKIDRETKGAPKYWNVISQGKSVRYDQSPARIRVIDYHIVSGIHEWDANYFNPDNIHITYRAHVHWPEGGWSQNADGRFGFHVAAAPGCPECFHMHWRWTTGLIKSAPKRFGGGGAIIVEGSKQDVTVHMDQGLFYYTCLGRGNSDQFLTHGAFFSSKGTYYDASVPLP
jgi:hypothetical protein